MSPELFDARIIGENGARGALAAARRLRTCRQHFHRGRAEVRAIAIRLGVFDLWLAQQLEQSARGRSGWRGNHPVVAAALRSLDLAAGGQPRRQLPRVRVLGWKDDEAG